MKIIILSTLLLLFLLMTAAIYLCIFYEVISVYDLSNCPIPDYPNCLETAQSCVHNSSF